MNIFKQLIRSIYSPKDIALTRNQGIGKTILYVFLLTLISIIPSTIYFSNALTSGVSSSIETIKKDLPDFSIENGQLISDEKEPIFIDKDDFTIIFDSSGSMDKDKLSNYDNAIALLKNDVALVAGGEIETFSYSIIDKDITKKDFNEFLTAIDSMLIVIIPVMILVIYIFSSGAQFIEISILAIFGLLLKNTLGKDIKYRHLWRMSAYTVTLPTIFFTIMVALKTTVPNGFVIDWFVSLIILLLAIKEIPSPKKEISE